ncbi:MAG TPA: ABC transporter substrate-binding protein [Hyphomicrobiales bacterium]|nr:ABC transporter substrate-binding protein [Hyphomicrobiales bacterium]
MRSTVAALAAIAVSIAGLAAGRAHAEDMVISQWGTSLSTGEFAVAMDEGFLKKHGAPVSGFVATGGGGTAVHAVVASELGYGLVSLAAAVDAIRHGIPIKIVNTETEYVDDDIVALKGSAIHSVADLKGKSLGIFSAGGATDGYSALAITKSGLKLTDVRRLAFSTTNGVMTALEKKVVPAVVMIEPFVTTSADKFQTVFVGHDLGAVVQVVGIATDDMIKNHPDQLRAILAARKEAVDAMKADPALAIRDIDHYYKTAPDAVIRKLLANGFWSEGAIDIPAMERVVEGSRLIGVFKGKVDWSKAVDASFLPK